MGAVSAVTDFVGDAVDTVVDAVDDVGHFVDDAVNDVVPGGWYTVAAVAAPYAIPELGAALGATEATATGLSTLPESVLTAGEAFGTGAGTMATDAALAAGAGASGTAAADMAISGLGEVPWESLGDQVGDFPLEGSFGSPTAPGVQEATENLLSNNVLQETAGAPLESIGDQPGDFPTEGSYGDPTAPGVQDAVQNLLDYNAQYAASGLSATDALRAANQAKNLLTGTPTTTTGGLTRTTTSTTSPFDISGGIQNLTPGLTKASQDYELSGLPHMAAGSSTNQYSFTDLGSKDSSYNPFAVDKFSYIRPGLTNANLAYTLAGLPGYLIGKKEGGSIPEGHNPEFFSEGGLNNRYVKGRGDGTSDSIPAMLASGEFVIPADVVSGLGNGDNDAGAKVLDEFLKTIRQHKRRADVRKLPPDSKGPLGYLLEAKRKVR